jgi:hypothetical protein
VVVEDVVVEDVVVENLVVVESLGITLSLLLIVMMTEILVMLFLLFSLIVSLGFTWIGLFCVVVSQLR